VSVPCAHGCDKSLPLSKAKFRTSNTYGFESCLPSEGTGTDTNGT